MCLSVCAPAGQGLGAPSNNEGSTSTMFKSTRKSRLAKIAAATAAVGSIAAIGLVGNSPAQADPKQYTSPIFGFGSDTLQDVTNAFAGFSFGQNFTPLQTSAATGQRQIVSWDAFPPGTTTPTAINCITTKVGSPQIQRPNGSGNGVRAISSAFNPGQRWPTTGTGPCGAARSMAGIVDFARSSAGPDQNNPASPTGPLVFVPFGRDYLGFAYLRPSGNPTTSLTPQQLETLHATGPQLIGGVPVIACGIQTGSGTYQSWMRSLNLATNGTGDPGTATCNGVGNQALGGRVQESNGPDITVKGSLLSSMQHPICDGVAGGDPVPCGNAQLVAGFSASQFIARSNNVGTPNPNLGPNGGLGGINGVAPVSGVAPNLVPVAAAYEDTTFGRDVFYVLAYETVAGPDAVPHLVDMFVGPNSKVCQATGTLNQHGFLSIGAGCGSLAQRANFRTN